ncbi:FMN-binding protein [Shewanella litorisediminis]|uniref:FMN-binding protein n=1 Tax=Shewanella litorisediminis TaxID=1173586 RepID=A0ABX7G0U4_9GAMM|nr:FMN-binding protein [Shewanella litorisediminis]MCL2918867.1 FMN-binding protein [Shewanella litorisediminis]QRH00940.1 FMN-binding protein [Shewanella litorisediminis]
MSDSLLNNSLWFIPMTFVAAPAVAADYLSIPLAQQLLFPSASSFIERPTLFDSGARSAIKSHAGTRQRQDHQPIWRVEKDGQLQGWFMVDDVIGKHEYITYAAAISADGEVMGIEVLSYRETHGAEVRDESWRTNFKGKSLKDPFKLDEDVPNISGATLSCRNLLDGVKRLLTIHELFLARES